LVAQAERIREVSRAPLPRAPLEPESALQQLRVRLTWLLVFRATVMTVLLGTSLVLRFTSSESQFARIAVALYAVAILSYASVLAGAIWMRRFGTRGIRPLAYAQLVFDAAIMSVIVLLTGGVESVFVFVFSLNILNAAAVLQKRGARTLAAVVTGLFTVILLLQLSGVVVPMGLDGPPPARAVLAPFLTHVASFVLVAVLAGFLTEQLKRTTENLDLARAQIERLEELYHAVLESLPSGVLTVDHSGRIVYVNTAGAEILGGEPGELVGRTLGERAPALAIPEGILDNARFERTALVARRERMIGGSVARLTGLEGIAGRVIVFQDLTELRKLQQDVARAERLAELGRFAAGLAHEIRNPLAAMIGCLQLLRRDNNGIHQDDGGDNQRMLGIVHREAERLSSLVSEFLTYARPSPPSVVETELLGLARETVAASRPGIEQGVVLDVTGEEAMVLCDPQQVRQALWNLIGNAVQAIRRNGEEGRGKVLVQVARHDGEAVLVVEDDGPGVPADIQPRIFEPFFTTRPDGTGLGLAAVHQMLAQQRGSIALEGGAQGGARFVIRLPTVSA
jgi:two-component system, NtrC family, sensor histidine kinase PilS